MSTLADSFETGPYTFHNPRRVSLLKQQACFACSHKLEKERGMSTYAAVEADCVQDGHPRIFHITCWGSGETGRDYRLRRQRDSEDWQRIQDFKRRLRGE